jgi:hypothetical protein
MAVLLDQRDRRWSVISVNQTKELQLAIELETHRAFAKAAFGLISPRDVNPWDLHHLVMFTTEAKIKAVRGKWLPLFLTRHTFRKNWP